MNVKLSQAFDLQMGKTPSRNTAEYWGGDHKWVSIADIGSAGKYIHETKEHITDKGISDSSIKVVPKDTVIMSFKLSIGKTAITSEDMYTNEAIMAFIDKGIYSVDPNYLYHLCCGTDWTAGTNKAVMGMTLNKATLSEKMINIPSIEEQKDITDKLDAVDLLIDIQRRQLTKLDDLVKSRFFELFYDKGYPVLKWNEVFSTTTGKLDSNAAVVGGEYPFFTCSKETLRIDKYAFEQEALLLAGNNAAGKYDVKYYNGRFNAYQRTYVLELKENWSYRLFQCQLEDKLEYLQQQSLGGLTKYLTLKILGELSFIIPPKELQNEFEVFVAEVDKSKLAVKQSLENLETLKKSLMQQYFG